MVSVASESSIVNRLDLDNIGQIAFSGGVLVPLPDDRSWPRTELPVIPTAQRTMHDVTGDGVADVILTTRITLRDMDGNGEADALHFRVVNGEVIQPDVALDCGPQEREQAIRRVIQGL
jgi:hypothetical protein